MVSQLMEKGALVLDSRYRGDPSASATCHHERGDGRGNRCYEGGILDMKHLLKLLDCTPEEITSILDPNQLKPSGNIMIHIVF